MNLLFSTGCPRCKVLAKKLDEKNIPYLVVSDEKELAARGIISVPVLCLDGSDEMLMFSDAIKWVNKEAAR